MGKKRILLVDDEESVVFSEQRMLERFLDCKVTTVTSSVEALKVFRSRPDQFHLVILDMIMPNMTGDILAKEFIAIRPDIPVILCTGYGESIIKDKAKAVGAAVLMKPFDLYEMARTIRKVLHKD